MRVARELANEKSSFQDEYSARKELDVSQRGNLSFNTGIQQAGTSIIILRFSWYTKAQPPSSLKARLEATHPHIACIRA